MDYNSGEEDLRGAIETGNLARVKQLVGSGINLNSVLHSASRRESATILGTAAFEGQTGIMDFLIRSGTLVNFKDPYFGRNTLHWACLGGWLSTVQLLLSHHVEVNCVDRDNVSPLLRASMTGNADIVKLLIKSGADVHQQDRLRSSALHYASFHGNCRVTSELIKAGCLHNNPTIFGQGTPLANLVYHRDYKNCRLLMEAGYTLENETWISGCENKSHVFRTDEHVYACVQLVLNLSRTAPPLKRICRTWIRRTLTGANLEERLSLLPLPVSLISYLCLQH